MIDDIYVFDDIIEKPYQELIKETLIGRDAPPTIDKVEDPFPWYYISDITDANHESTFQGRFGFTHQYATPEDGIISKFHSLFFGLIQNSCKKLKIKEIDILNGRSFLQTPTKISREDAIKEIVNISDEKDIFVSTTGMPSRELFEIRENSIDKYTKVIQEIMEYANLPKVSLNVNLKVDTGFGDNWAEAH